MFTSWQMLLVPDVMLCGSILRQALTVRLSVEIKKVSYGLSWFCSSLWRLPIWSCSDLIIIRIRITTRCYCVYSSSVSMCIIFFDGQYVMSHFCLAEKLIHNLQGKKKMKAICQHVVGYSEKEQSFTSPLGELPSQTSTSWGFSIVYLKITITICVSQ